MVEALRQYLIIPKVLPSNCYPAAFYGVIWRYAK